MKGYIPTMFLTLALMIGATSAFAGDGILILNATDDGILIKNLTNQDSCAPTSDDKGGIIDIILGTFFNTKDGILIHNLGDGILIHNITQPPVNCGILILN